MPWRYRHSEQHVCQLPKIDDTVWPGDIWQCDVVSCGKHYIVKDEQRDGLYYSVISAENASHQLRTKQA